MNQPQYAPQYAQQQPHYPQPATRHHARDKSTAALLAFFLGGLGIHKFYLGNVGLGVVYLLFCWTLIPALIGLIETIILANKSKQQFDLEFNS
jgi:TM2 domain-containing membrane protein YozV